MKKTIKRIFVALLFLAGLSLLLYPFIANQWNNYRQKRLISDYNQTVNEMNAVGGIDYEAEWERATRYNDAIFPASFLIPLRRRRSPGRIQSTWPA